MDLLISIILTIYGGAFVYMGYVLLKVFKLLEVSAKISSNLTDDMQTVATAIRALEEKTKKRN